MKDIKTIIANGLNNSMSYSDYRTMVTTMAETNGTTGPIKDDARIEYTALNERRMSRLDKKMAVSDTDQLRIQDLVNEGSPLTFLTITESWCGDAAQTMPVINKLAEASDNVNMKVVLRDDNLDLMDEFLTNGGRSIPKIVLLDADKNVLGEWGPRPETAAKMVVDYKAEHGVIDAQIKQDLQMWYNKDKGQSAVNDILTTLEKTLVK